MKLQTIFFPVKTRRYIIPIVAFSICYNLPKFFELRTATETDADAAANSTTSNYTIEPSAMRVNEVYIKVYCIWMNFIFMGLGPFCMLIGLNALTLRTLLMQTKGAVSASTGVSYAQSKKTEIALAKVSLAIVFVFILCHSVKWIPNLYELARLAREDKRAWPPWVESVTHVSHFLMTVNSSVNFYIYYFKHHAGGRLRWLLPCCCFCICCGSHDGGAGGAGGSGAAAAAAAAHQHHLLSAGGGGGGGSALTTMTTTTAATGGSTTNVVLLDDDTTTTRRRKREEEEEEEEEEASSSLLADFRFSFNRGRQKSGSPCRLEGGGEG